jgi:hypothetical protein
MINDGISSCVAEANDLLKSLQQARTQHWRWSGETKLVAAGCVIVDFADPSSLLEYCDRDLIECAPDLRRVLQEVVDDYGVLDTELGVTEDMLTCAHEELAAAREEVVDLQARYDALCAQHERDNEVVNEVVRLAVAYMNLTQDRRKRCTEP